MIARPRLKLLVLLAGAVVLMVPHTGPLLRPEILSLASDTRSPGRR